MEVFLEGILALDVEGVHYLAVSNILSNFSEPKVDVYQGSLVMRDKILLNLFKLLIEPIRRGAPHPTFPC